MGNISIKFNLLKLKATTVRQIAGKGGVMTDCVVIPVKLNNIFTSDKGAYLEAQAFEIRDKKPDSKDTHLIKQSLPKDVYNTMSDADKAAMPILGNCILWGGGGQSTGANSSSNSSAPTGYTAPAAAPEDDDLPF